MTAHTNETDRPPISRLPISKPCRILAQKDTLQKSSHVLQLWPDDAIEPSRRALIIDSLQKAEQASGRLSGSMMQRSSSGTGEKLKSNFALLLDTILEQDSHLLSQEEHDLLQSYQVVPPKKATVILAGPCVNSSILQDKCFCTAAAIKRGLDCIPSLAVAM